MTHEPTIPSADFLRMKWQNKFAKGLATHGPSLGVTADTINSTKADADFLTALMSYLTTTEAYGSNLVTYKNDLTTGNSAVIADIPAFSAMPTHVAVAPGIITRSRALVTILKANKALTPVMIQDMGLEGNEIIFDFDNIIVNAKIVLKNSHAYLHWNHQGTDAVDIKCDYGDGVGMIAVARISTVHYSEPRLPAAGVDALYKYMFRYVVKDVQVGEWTPIISIAVKGI